MRRPDRGLSRYAVCEQLLQMPVATKWRDSYSRAYLLVSVSVSVIVLGVSCRQGRTTPTPTAQKPCLTRSDPQQREFLAVVLEFEDAVRFEMIGFEDSWERRGEHARKLRRDSAIPALPPCAEGARQRLVKAITEYRDWVDSYGSYEARAQARKDYAGSPEYPDRQQISIKEAAERATFEIHRLFSAPTPTARP